MNDPAFTSLVRMLKTASLPTKDLEILEPTQTDSEAQAKKSSIVAKFPPDSQMYFSSLDSVYQSFEASLTKSVIGDATPVTQIARAIPTQHSEVAPSSGSTVTEWTPERVNSFPLTCS